MALQKKYIKGTKKYYPTNLNKSHSCKKKKKIHSQVSCPNHAKYRPYMKVYGRKTPASPSTYEQNKVIRSVNCKNENKV